jgi:DNA-3-methyladenine glycosylase I
MQIPTARSTAKSNVQRCSWATTDLLIDYHDHEWGVPVHEDRKLFEFLVLEGMQAGLSWETVLKKRKNYRAAFDNFDVARVASYSKRKINSLMTNKGLIRNRLKIEAAVTNAQCFLIAQEQFGSFNEYVWALVGGSTKQNRWKVPRDVPPSTSQSDMLSKDLQRRGFKFVGTTICYAFMQAVGMVNDHLVGCFRYRAYFPN